MNSNPEVQNENESQERHGKVLAGILAVGRMASAIILPLALVAAMLSGLYIAGMSIHHLGAIHFKMAQPWPLATALATVGTAVFLVAYLATTKHLGKPISRATALAVGMMWLALLVILAILDMALTAGAVTFQVTGGLTATEASNAAKAWQIAIPPELSEPSKVIYSALAALPAVVLLILWAVHSSETPHVRSGINEGGRTVGMFVLKLALATAMFLFEAFFGLAANYSPMMAIPAALLNAIAFTSALNAMTAAKAEGRNPGIWSGIALFYVLLMAAIAYEVGLTFGGEKAFPFAPRPEWLRTFAETGFLASIGLSAIVLFLTKFTDKPKGYVAPVRDAWTVRARRGMDDIAGVVDHSRSTLGTLRGQTQAPALTAAKDAEELPEFRDAKNGQETVDTGAESAARGPKRGRK
jgi:hypothetical protein